VTPISFDNKVFLEQLRAHESQELLDGDATLADDGYGASGSRSSFDERLLLRALHIVKRAQLAGTLSRAARIFSRARTIGLAVAMLMGATGAIYAVDSGATVNIYWLLIVLLGFNFLSIVLWLVGIAAHLDGLVGGVLAKLVNVLADQIRHIKKATAAPDKAWLVSHIGGRVGKWQLSTLTHQLWLAYLLSGLGMLVLVFSARQFDFIWGTTLLPNDAFLKLTAALGWPLQALGLEMPTAQQVAQTRVGSGAVLGDAQRYRWAQFLLGALLMYGIIPRMALLGWAVAMRRAARQAFELDYYLPYYIRLRQQLMPLAGRGEIVDQDIHTAKADKPVRTETAKHQLPGDALWAAIELDEGLSWPPPYIANDRIVGQVIDRSSLATILHRLEAASESTGCTLAVAVSASRAPDRGLQRIVASLNSACEQCWLVLLQHGEGDTTTEARLTDWYRLAQAANVPADHVINMSTI
jgi:hypothetical protein